MFYKFSTVNMQLIKKAIVKVERDIEIGFNAEEKGAIGLERN